MTDIHEGAGGACVVVDPGVCRFRTKITAYYKDGNICYEIDSDCPHAKKLTECMPAEVSPFDALRMPFDENVIYKVCGKALAHSACPLPSALIKAAEVAAGFGLRRNVRFEFES